MIVNNVSTIIGNRRMTTASVAKEAGVSYEAVRRLYDNVSTRLDVNTLDALCEVLECQPGDLFQHQPNGK